MKMYLIAVVVAVVGLWISGAARASSLTAGGAIDVEGRQAGPMAATKSAM
jgi:hypothetical protein